MVERIIPFLVVYYIYYMNSQKFLEYLVFSGDLNIIDISSRAIISTINPYSFLIAQKAKEFKKALQSSDILLPDGEGIVWASNLLYGKKIKKIAGYDIFVHLMKTLQEQKGSCFFFGSSEETLKKIKNIATFEYPSIEINYLSPPFKDEFSEEENTEFTSFINSKNPDVLFVGMTAPKQEKWVYKNREKLNVSVIASIGAVFDFYAGNVKRPSKIWIDLGLEWFVRLLQEPRRLWKRNFIYTPLFVMHILIAKVKMK